MNDRPQFQGRDPALVRIAQGSDQALSAVEFISLVVSCGALAIIMVILFLDGVLRYLMNSPLTFAMDIVTLYLLSAAILLVLSYTLRHGGHISVDLFVHQMSERARALLIGLVLLLSTTILALMSYELSQGAWESWVRGERLIGLHPLPLWLSRAIVALGFLLLIVRVVHMGLFNLLAGLTGDMRLAFLNDPLETEIEKEVG